MVSLRIILISFSIFIFISCNQEDESSIIETEINVAFILSDSIINQGESVQFTNTTNGVNNSIEWSFAGGNPNSSVQEEQEVVFSTPGVYDVNLTIKNSVEPLGIVLKKQVVVLPTQSLLAFYPFDDNPNDVSGNEFNGLLYNGVFIAENRFGMEKKAFLFDGQSTYVETTTEIDQNLSEGVTFSVWIKLDMNNESENSTIISNYNGTGVEGSCNERVGFNLGINSEQQLFLSYAVDENIYFGRISATGTIESDEWIHIVGTWNGAFSSSAFELYINGVRGDVSNYQAGVNECQAFIESNHPITIGINKCSTGYCYPFGGSIDDVRIYDRILLEAEIFALSKG